MLNMQRVTAIDSVVLQVITGDADLYMAKKIEAILGGQLEILKCSPIRPTKEQRKEWRDVTGRTLPKTAAFVALLYHPRGQSIPLVRYGNGKGLEVHFHGLQQYERNELVLNDGAIQRLAILEEFLSVWDEPLRLSRLDRCIDLIGLKWCDYSNTRKHRTLCKREGTALFEKTTVYYQPPKPKYTKVTAYDKRRTNLLSYPLTRIEFSFKGQYWRSGEAINAGELIEAATLKTDAYIKRLFR
ncbi:MAG: hypothetical protein Q7T91_04565 [Sulfuricurvum sp.]|nr:hypothetical protein [Sulfuricurvum sp.]